MRMILTAVLFLAGLFNLFLGVSFLLDPARLGAAFNLSPVGPGGLAVLRADLTAFFLVAGGCQLWGGWRRNGDLWSVGSIGDLRSYRPRTPQPNAVYAHLGGRCVGKRSCDVFLPDHCGATRFHG